jgi:hypothetical protein
MSDPDVTLSHLLDAFATDDREAARVALIDLLCWTIKGRTLPRDPRPAAFPITRRAL